MCGINGFLGNFPRELIQKMNSSTTHRGPDGYEIWEDYQDKISFGHNRLAIIDLSPNGRQPMIDNSGRFVITYNGEIYNYKDLRSRLERQGHIFRGHSDTEVLLQLYVEEGSRCLNLLNGIFSFAVWDREKKELFIARDHYGIKPLYYATTSRGFIFSSEFKALTHSKCLDGEIDHEALGRYLAFLWSPGAQTLFKSVKKLLPGHFLKVNLSNQVNLTQYYQPQFKQNLALDSSMSFESAKIKTKQLLNQAVERQLIADVEVGAFLSGGVDSSAIVHFAQKKLDRKMNCFTIKLDEQQLRDENIVSDYPYALRVATDFGVNLHLIEVSENCIEELESVIYHLDEPQADPAIINTLLIARLARKNNVPVLLSGAGGDDLFSGYRRHLAINYFQWTSKIPNSFSSIIKAPLFLLQGIGVPRRYLEKFLRPLNYPNEYVVPSYFLWADLITISSLLVNPRGIDFSQVFAPFIETIKKTKSISNLQKMLAIDLQHFLIDHNLNYTDKMSMAASIETRVPFLDRDLVEFALHVPDKFKIKNGQAKYLLKESLRGEIPDYILNRPKTGFGAPLRKWIQGPLKNNIRNYLSKENIESTGIFNYSAVDNIIKLNDQSKADLSYLIYSILCVQMWFNIFKKTQSNSI